MISGLSASSNRLAIAIAASLLLHSWAIWGTHFRLPRFEPAYPPLQARLERLVNTPELKQPAEKHKPLPQVAAKPSPVGAAFSPSIPSGERLPLALPLSLPPGEIPNMPPKAQLTFSITSGNETGIMEHSLDFIDGQYELRSLTRLPNKQKMNETNEVELLSSGYYSKEKGLQPHQYVEQGGTSGFSLSSVLNFDFSRQLANDRQGEEMEIPSNTQDSLSLLYQIPPVDGRATIFVPVNTGEKIEEMLFGVSDYETLSTPFGELITVHLTRQPAPGETGLEIWLAREYRMFPVKIKHIGADGNVISESIITDIRIQESNQDQ